MKPGKCYHVPEVEQIQLAGASRIGGITTHVLMHINSHIDDGEQYSIPMEIARKMIDQLSRLVRKAENTASN